ncbi:DUF4148 domain-containing protein [Paraburkholderia azotifigens]|uniref:DUF4148 domain-containing protein n=1 Tax=Paraburkholderia azotifigens TaxID=2057004 RepID=UPI0038B99264
MKKLLHAALVTTLLASPVPSFAQSNGTVSRAQVKAELRELEQAGYYRARSEAANYPGDIQAAEARVTQRNLASRSGANSAEGGVTSGSALSGSRTPRE